MKGNAKVLEELNRALREELTAINQYFLHAEMCENWGYEKLCGYLKKQSIGEMKHAESLIERILFLDGTPNMQPLQLTIGANVKDMLKSDLDLEVNAVAMYNAAVKIALENGDNGSRDLFVELLKDEEEHVDWLEAQVHQIGELGYPHLEEAYRVAELLFPLLPVDRTDISAQQKHVRTADNFVGNEFRPIEQP